MTDYRASQHGRFKSFFFSTNNSDNVSAYITKTVETHGQSSAIIDYYVTLSETCDRYSVSFRTGAAVVSASAVLNDRQKFQS